MRLSQIVPMKISSMSMKSCARGPVVKTVVMCRSSPNYPYNSLKLTRRIKYLMLSTKITLLRWYNHTSSCQFVYLRLLSREILQYAQVKTVIFTTKSLSREKQVNSAMAIIWTTVKSYYNHKMQMMRSSIEETSRSPDSPSLEQETLWIRKMQRSQSFRRQG